MKKILPLITVVVAVSWLLRGQTNAPNAAAPGQPPPAEQALATLERDWANAVKSRDAEKLGRIEAEEYEFTDPGGQVWTKARQLETIRAGDLEIDSFQLSELKVRVYGDTAVVRYRITWTGRYMGTDLSGPQRVTDVFVKRDGRWQCVASHTTRLTQP